MISREEIQNLAQLSRLKLGDEEVAALQKDFDSILEYVGQIQNAVPQGDTSKQDTALEESPFGSLLNVMREDKPRTADDPMAGKAEAILAAASKREGDHFVVRKIIDRDLG